MNQPTLPHARQGTNYLKLITKQPLRPNRSAGNDRVYPPPGKVVLLLDKLQAPALNVRKILTRSSSDKKRRKLYSSA